MPTILKEPKQAKIPNKVIELVGAREFDGVVDITGQPWVQIDGKMYPLKLTKFKQVKNKPVKGAPL